MRPASSLALSLLLLASAGCATAPEAPASEAPASEAPAPAPEGGEAGQGGEGGYHDAARALYDAAVKAREGRDYQIAVARFDQLRNRYPYSRYAPLSELGLADTLFDQGRYLEAADAYRTFVRLRPAHPKVDYAAYREALALAKEAPSNFFLLPPAYEKDLSQVKQLQRVLAAFLEAYPESEHREEARELLDETRLRLARHELYVADFYRKKEKWRGVVGRLETVLARYGDLEVLDPARVRLAEAYLKLEEPRPRAARALVGDVLASEAVDGELRTRALSLQQRLAALPPDAFEGEEPPVPEVGTELEPVQAPEGGYAPPKEAEGQGPGPGGRGGRGGPGGRGGMVR